MSGARARSLNLTLFWTCVASTPWTSSYKCCRAARRATMCGTWACASPSDTYPKGLRWRFRMQSQNTMWCIQPMEPADIVGAVERRIIVAVIALQPAASWERVYRWRCAFAYVLLCLSLCLAHLYCFMLADMCHVSLLCQHTRCKQLLQCPKRLARCSHLVQFLCLCCCLLPSFMTGVPVFSGVTDFAVPHPHPPQRVLPLLLAEDVPSLLPTRTSRTRLHASERIGEASNPGLEKRKDPPPPHTDGKRLCPVACVAVSYDSAAMAEEDDFVPTTQYLNDLRACLASPSLSDTSSDPQLSASSLRTRDHSRAPLLLQHLNHHHQTTSLASAVPPSLKGCPPQCQ